MLPIGIGIIGYGYWGPNFARIFANNPETSLVACCDIQLERLEEIKKNHSNTKIRRDYNEILEDPDVSAVIVSTSAASHYDIIKNALLHGKHVLSEKPLTTNYKQAAELCKIADKVDRVLMVDHIYLFHPAFKKIQSLMEDKAIGDLYYIYSIRTGLGPIRNDVNVLYDLAPHDLSMILEIVGKYPHSVEANGSTYLQGNIEDVIFANMFFDGGVTAHIHVSWLDAVKTRRLTIIGSKKMIVFDDTENLERIKIYDKGVTNISNPDSYGEFRLLMREGDIYSPKID
ncbi:MAG: Gfo/Idh/MocA family protein, partial [Acidobacteriota bacterium]